MHVRMTGSSLVVLAGPPAGGRGFELPADKDVQCLKSGKRVCMSR
jgi:hypothetical protein